MNYRLKEILNSDTIKNIITIANKSLLVINVVICGVLVYQLHKLPEALGLNKPIVKDTIIQTRIASLQTKGSFIYFEGKFLKTKFKFRDKFSYDIAYPSEVFEGWLIEAKSSVNDQVYYVWSRTEPNISTEITTYGWFFTDNLSKPGSINNNKAFYEVLYPIVEKRWTDNEVKVN